jgi:hypothetical protein
VALIDEKIGDLINYLILLEAMLKEDRLTVIHEALSKEGK